MPRSIPMINPKREKYLNPGLLIITILAAAFMLAAGLRGLDIKTDITASLPTHHPVIRDALFFFDHHPIQDRVVISVGLGTEDPDRLVECAAMVEKKLMGSGLFTSVGMDQYRNMMPDLMDVVVENLPFLFTHTQLETEVAPRLTPAAVQDRLAATYHRLSNLEEIGSARYIPVDPLGLKEIVLARLKGLSPVKDFNFHKGKLLSGDRRHCLIMATPKSAGTDSKFAAQAMELIRDIQAQAEKDFARPGEVVHLTSVGAFRAAYDNENIVKGDVQKAIFIATLTIALLLFLAFPRPWIGLLALVPAVFGAIAGLFVYSLLFDSISLMVLGFGGAIISITVDHGIAYLLFLDRPHKAFGKTASLEVRAVGLVATLTTICAFLSLGLSDFKILEELGKFTALGMGFSFLFIHSLFPRIVPMLPPARPRKLPLKRVVTALVSFGNRGAWSALALVCVLIWFAWPTFNANLSSMNTVSRETQDADERFREIWGQDFAGKSHLMVTADAVSVLQDVSDQLAGKISAVETIGIPASGVTLSMIFPGTEQKKENYQAWTRFWTSERVSLLKQSLTREGKRFGFTQEAFDPFLRRLIPAALPDGPVVIPRSLYPVMGISQSKSDGGTNAPWIWTVDLMRNPAVDSQSFYDTFNTVATVFEPELFSSTLGTILFSTFMKMFFIIAAAVLLLLFIFFLDLKLTVFAMLPVLFAFISTLGTMKLVGHDLDIPSLILSIIVFGMGIDYSLFFIRSYQRYRDESHPSLELIRLAVFMAGISTLIGFGVMCLAEHSLLQSAGLSSLLGIGYCLLGTFLILPPLLRRHFICPATQNGPGPLFRYRTAEAYPRMFARIKLTSDPMFQELPEFLSGLEGVSRILDIGTGYGVPASFLLDKFPHARVFGIEPNPEAQRVSSMVMSQQGDIVLGGAPDIPAVSGPVQIALMLDMSHFLTSSQFNETLEKIRAVMAPGGRLIIRAVIFPVGSPSPTWRLEALKLKLNGVVPHYLSVETITDLITQAQFRIQRTQMSDNNPETAWFVAEVPK